MLKAFLSKTLWFYVTVFLLVPLVFSCGRRLDKDRNKTVFRYNESAGITSLDPAFARNQANIWACNQLFNGLVQLDDQLRVQPCIASHWEINDKGTLYTFYLRKDVCFHDADIFPNGKGRIVTAKDVEYSFLRLVDPTVASSGSWVFNQVKHDSFRYAFSAVNDSVFSIELEHPFPPFLSLLSTQYCSVVPHEAIEKYGKEFRRHPVGTGPFQFKMWKEGVKLVMVKNPSYFEKENGKRLPYLDAVAITFIIDKQAAFLEFVKGNLDFMSGIDANYKDEVLTRSGRLNPKYNDRFQLITQPYLNTEYLGFLVDTSSDIMKDNPMRLKLVRQAINYGFDRKKMMRYLRNNIGVPACNGFVPLGMPGFGLKKVKGYDYDPAKARKLLNKAGYKDGDGPAITLSTNSSYLDICQYIQQQLNEIGFKVKIDVSPPATLREMIAQSKVPFFRGSWIADYPDAENYLSLFYSDNFCPKGPNYTHFSNKRFDKLYQLSSREMNDSIRFGLYREMDQIVMDEAPVVVLYYDQVLRFVRKEVQDLGSNPLNLLTLKRVKKTNH